MCVCGYLDDQFSSLHTFQYQFSVPTCIHYRYQYIQWTHTLTKVHNKREGVLHRK